MSKTNKSPAFQFYPSDFLSDENVSAMTNHEIGCYIKLICFCWNEGSIPSGIKNLARLLREREKDMAVLWQAISPCFIPGEDGDRLLHPRLEAEREKQAAFSAKKAAAGKSGMEKRWGKREEKPLPLWQGLASTPSPIKQATAEPTPPSVATNIDTPVAPESKVKKKKSSQHIELPDGVNPEIYADFLKVRTHKGAPFTSTALNGFISEAKQAGVSLNEAFSICCHKGWVGFQATWYENLNRQQQAGRPNYPTKGRLEDSMTSEEYRAYVLKELGVGTGAADYVDGEELTEALTSEGRLPWLSQ